VPLMHRRCTGMGAIAGGRCAPPCTVSSWLCPCSWLSCTLAPRGPRSDLRRQRRGGQVAAGTGAGDRSRKCSNERIQGQGTRLQSTKRLRLDSSGSASSVRCFPRLYLLWLVHRRWRDDPLGQNPSLLSNPTLMHILSVASAPSYLSIVVHPKPQTSNSKPGGEDGLGREGCVRLSVASLIPPSFLCCTRNPGP